VEWFTDGVLLLENAETHDECRRYLDLADAAWRGCTRTEARAG
jgi:hypothetical protein